MLKKIFIIVIILAIAAGIILAIYSLLAPKTFKMIDSSTGEVLFQFQYSRKYSVVSPTIGIAVVSEGKETKDDFSNIIVEFEALTYAKDIQTYENTLKLAKEQNIDSSKKPFIPGYATKTIGNQTVYYLNDLNDDPGRLNGILFANDKSINISYNKDRAGQAEDLIKNLNLEE